MQTKHLRLVPISARRAQHAQAKQALVQVTTDRRKLFWRAYLSWLATATNEEIEQLALVLAEHAHHVRTLMDAVTDALRFRETALRLPPSLLAELHSSGWRPVTTSSGSAPVATPHEHEGWPVVA